MVKSFALIIFIPLVYGASFCSNRSTSCALCVKTKECTFGVLQTGYDGICEKKDVMDGVISLMMKASSLFQCSFAEKILKLRKEKEQVLKEDPDSTKIKHVVAQNVSETVNGVSIGRIEMPQKPNDLDRNGFQSSDSLIPKPLGKTTLQEEEAVKQTTATPRKDLLTAKQADNSVDLLATTAMPHIGGSANEEMTETKNSSASSTIIMVEPESKIMTDKQHSFKCLKPIGNKDLFDLVGASFTCPNRTSETTLERYLRTLCQIDRVSGRNFTQHDETTKLWLLLNPAKERGIHCKALFFRRKNCFKKGTTNHKMTAVSAYSTSKNFILFAKIDTFLGCDEKVVKEPPTYHLIRLMCRAAVLFDMIDFDIQPFDLAYGFMNGGMYNEVVCNVLFYRRHVCYN